MGEEDPYKAAIRGLKGYRRYKEVGYHLFPEAEEPGFQPGDVGAFIINNALDPLNYVGYGMAKTGGKLLGKGVARVGKYLAPEAKALLERIPLAHYSLSHGEKAGMVAKDLDTLGFSSAGEALKHIYAAFPHLRNSGLLPDVEKLVGKASKILANEDLIDDKGLDYLWAYLRQIEANYRPVAKNALQSAAQNFGRMLLPQGTFLRHFGGKSGLVTADKVERAGTRAAQAHQIYKEKIFKQLGHLPEETRKRSRYIREKGLKTDPNAEALEAAKLWGNDLDEFRDVAANFTDDFGNRLQVYDPTEGVQDWRDFKDMVIPDYYPWVVDPKYYTKKGVAKLRMELDAQNVSPTQIQKTIDNLGIKPKKAGHLEVARIGHPPYEKDPLKALPNYYYNSILRMELAKEFGVDNRTLNVLLSNLEKTDGFDPTWVKKLGDMIVGTDVHQRFWDNAANMFGSIQAISKLGLSTSVANMSQVVNHFIRSGNFIESLRRGGFILPGGGMIGVSPEAASLGAAAFGRGLKDEMYRMGHGGRNWLSSMYIKGIGFNWTERVGRHLGAVGGELDANHTASVWAKLQGSTDPKKLKKAGRLASELKRKFGIDLDQQYGDFKLLMDGPENAGKTIRQMILEDPKHLLPDRVGQHAGIKAANATMHAFGPMDLPQWWRTPGARLLMQFKSYIYKQMGFLWQDVMAPGLQYLATDGAKGSLGPMMRGLIGLPIAAELTSHLRDVAKSLPSQLYAQGKYRLGKSNDPWADWDYKDPFWEDPDPAVRVLSDLTYIGAFGIAGDIVEAAKSGRLLRYGVGPTVTDITDYVEALSGEMDIGKQLTRQLPGALGLPYSHNIFE
jgi:hypothetical protein